MRTPLVFELHQREILSEHWFFGVWFGLWEKFGLNENLVWESEETSIYSCWPKCFCLPLDRLPDFRLQFYSDHQQMWNFSNVLHWQDLQSLQFYPRITRKLCFFLAKKNKLTMENTFIIYLYQIASFCVIIYSNTSSLNFFCENSSQIGKFKR